MILKTILPTDMKSWDTNYVDSQVDKCKEIYTYHGGLATHQGRGRMCVIVKQLDDTDNPMILVQYLESYKCKHLGTIIKDNICWYKDLIKV